MTTDGRVARSAVAVRAVSRGIAMVALGALTIHVVINAFARYVLRDPIEGTLEYSATWYMPAMVFFGIFLAQASGSHVAAGILFDRLPRRSQIEAQVLADVLTLVVFLGFGWFGLQEALELAEIKATAGASTVPMWQTSFLVPLAAVMVSVQVVANLISVLRTGDADVVARRARGELVAEAPKALNTKRA